MARRKPRRQRPWLTGDEVAWVWQAARCRSCEAPFESTRTLMTFGRRRRKGKNAICLSCSGLLALAFVPAGDSKLTRRASKYSARRAVVVGKPNKYITRYGILVEPDALKRALDECACELPRGCLEPIANTDIILPPRFDAPPASARPRASTETNAQAKPPQRKSPRPAKNARYIDLLPRLIREAFPDCKPHMATRVAKHVLHHAHDLPPAEDLSTDHVGPLVSRYLRRRVAHRDSPT